MDVDLTIKVAATSIVATVYGCILFSGKIPQLKRRGYVLNLCGFALCAWAVALSQPEPVWLAAWLFNLTLQNPILAARSQ